MELGLLGFLLMMLVPIMQSHMLEPYLGRLRLKRAIYELACEFDVWRLPMLPVAAHTQSMFAQLQMPRFGAVIGAAAWLAVLCLAFGPLFFYDQSPGKQLFHEKPEFRFVSPDMPNTAICPSR